MTPEGAVAQAARELGLCRLSTAVAQSAPARRALRDGRLRRVRRGVFCTSPAHRPTRREALVAALMMVPPPVVAFGVTAARLWRLEGLPTPAETERLELLTIRPNRRRLDGCHLRYVDSLPPLDYPQGIPATSLAATVVTLCASLAFAEALAVAESAMRGDDRAKSEIAAEFRDRPPRQGASAVARVLSVADIWSESVLESHSRAVWIAAGLPEPIQQATIYRNRRFIARVDFLWPEAMLVAEVDGLAKYDDPLELRREKERQNRLVAEGYTVLRFTWADIRGDPVRVVAQISSCLALAA